MTKIKLFRWRRKKKTFLCQLSVKKSQEEDITKKEKQLKGKKRKEMFVFCFVFGEMLGMRD